MCGLFGWIGNIKGGQRAALAVSLATANVARGSDSWGVATSGRAKRWTAFRGLGRASRHAAWLATLPHVVGHTRAATLGSVTLRNAHPFAVGNILLAHNGVVYNARKLLPELPGAEVDSELIAHRVAHGLPLTDLDGYGVISWVDQSRTGRGAVYLCQIGGGSLAVAELTDRDGYPCGAAWSSAEHHLWDALAAARLTATVFTPKPGTVYQAGLRGVERTSRKLAWMPAVPKVKAPKSDLAPWLHEAWLAAAADHRARTATCPAPASRLPGESRADADGRPMVKIVAT